MSRYFAKRAAYKQPKADWSDDYPLLPDIHVPCHEPIDTGLVDVRGDSIMRAPNPMGFGRDEEWS